MVLAIAYVAITIVLCLICMNVKRGIKKSLFIGIPIIGVLLIANIAFNTMPNFQKLITEKDVYKIESVNTDTIVYVDKDGNYTVAGKDEVLLVKGNGLKLSLMTSTKFTKVGRVLIVQDLPKNWTAYIVPKDDTK